MSLTYSAAVEQTITAGEQIHQIVNGTVTTEVTVEDGSKVPSIRKALLDNFYFKDPIAWQVGQTENVFNQLRKFTDGSWWYAPSATASNPISMGSTPVGNPLWKIYDFDAIGKLTPQLREALRRSYAEAGFNLVDGSFEAGGTLVNANDVLLQERTGKAFSGPAGTVVAGTNPASGGFVDKSGVATSASAISNANGGSVQDFIDDYELFSESILTEVDNLKIITATTNDNIASLSTDVSNNSDAILVLQNSQDAAVVGFATQAQLFAALNYDEGTIAYVTNDTLPTNNGTYLKFGASGSGSWQQSSSDLASQAYQKATTNEANKADKSQLEFESTADETDRLYLIDADGRITATIEDTDKMFRPVDFETTYSSETSIYVIDADNRLIASAGSDNQPATDAALKDRVDKSLNEFGLNRTHKFGEWYLRETRQRTRKMLLNESQKLTILMIGDSWTHAATRYSGNFGLEMQKAFGGTSAGFTGFSWGYGTPPNAGWNTNFDPSTTSIAISGAWVVKYGKQTSPDICAASSSTAGDTIVITTTREATSALLFANNNSAQIRYKYNSGAWNSLTLSGAVEYFTLATPPVGSFDITFEVVSGVCDLYGLSLTNDGSGVVIHKVGATGSQLAAWANLSNNPEWRANIAALAPNLITILHGTNDQNNYTAAQFKANGQTLIDNIRSVLPLCDILLISPCENGRANSIPMSAYQDVTQQLAYENKCAFLNLQHVFGDSFSEYASTSPRNWFNADLIHPEPSTGGRAILDAVYKIVTE